MKGSGREMMVGFSISYIAEGRTAPIFFVDPADDELTFEEMEVLYEKIGMVLKDYKNGTFYENAEK